MFADLPAPRPHLVNPFRLTSMEDREMQEGLVKVHVVGSEIEGGSRNSFKKMPGKHRTLQVKWSNHRIAWKRWRHCMKPIRRIKHAWMRK